GPEGGHGFARVAGAIVQLPGTVPRPGEVARDGVPDGAPPVQAVEHETGLVVRAQRLVIPTRLAQEDADGGQAPDHVTARDGGGGGSGPGPGPRRGGGGGGPPGPGPAAPPAPGGGPPGPPGSSRSCRSGPPPPRTPAPAPVATGCRSGLTASPPASGRTRPHH